MSKAYLNALARARIEDTRRYPVRWRFNASPRLAFRTRELLARAYAALFQHRPTIYRCRQCKTHIRYEIGFRNKAQIEQFEAYFQNKATPCND